MIRISVNLDKGEAHIDMTGHADYAEEGKDIVCAGVSAIIQTAIMGLQVMAQKYPENVEVTIK